MEYIEIKAEAFRILRAYEGKSAQVALQKIKDHLGIACNKYLV